MTCNKCDAKLPKPVTHNYESIGRIIDIATCPSCGHRQILDILRHDGWVLSQYKPPPPENHIPILYPTVDKPIPNDFNNNAVKIPDSAEALNKTP